MFKIFINRLLKKEAVNFTVSFFSANIYHLLNMSKDE